MDKDGDVLFIQLQAGKIKRWHTLPIIGEQTVADHTYGVCQILRYLYGETPCYSVIYAALDHDVPEYYTGDIPFDVKKKSHSMRVGIKMLEIQYVKDGGKLHSLTIDEKLALRFADLAEMGFFAMHQWKLGNDTMEVVINVLENLPEVKLARHINIRILFEEFIKDGGER